MARKYIDCRDYPSEMNCTLALCADNEDELLDSPDFRAQLRQMFKEGTPPA